MCEVLKWASLAADICDLEAHLRLYILASLMGSHSAGETGAHSRLWVGWDCCQRQGGRSWGQECRCG